MSARLRAVAIATLVAFAAVSSAHEADAAPGRAYQVIDAETGRSLDSHAPNRVMHPASLTKMMTLYLVFDAIAKGELSLDQKITMSRHAASMPPSKLGLRRGSRITVRNAVRAAAVFSANDAAVALAEAVAGSERAFAQRMTHTAKLMGMRRTTFKNASGLTAAGHLSTPSDMAILARRLWLDFPKNYIVFGREKVRMHGQTRRATNRLLRSRNDVDGIKTGYTRAAGYNLAAAAEDDGDRVIVVMMGERNSRTRDRRVSDLLNRGLEKMARDPLLVAAAPRPRLRPNRSYEALEVAAIAAETRQVLEGPRLQASARIRVPAPQKRWSVQVGAYDARDLAVRQVRAISALNAPPLSGALQRVEKAPTASVHYRARFAGLDAKEARAACGWLVRRGVNCALVPPNGWDG